ncbi:hypothetical protein CR203_06295 [Salipaludibacillus neizhouensis]|uniref:Sigma-54 factor interaction domain-containing protein n=1 Tax=Salipaludibacillus neizhouensis TaxID=885475 RepID=A0A3A9KC44_9BACI|nr:sigma-54-dependent transcriptional regulator [Salipaludibacillus neizhouensis]RKL68102.1 hypothetical protein CR203_06295 [Salipaludibacillus neizhouensis]
MKIKVLVIAPYKGMVELIKNMDSQFHDFEITLHEADLNQSLELVQMYKDEQKNFDFIISRGGTAKMLRENNSLPVIDVGVSGYDILRILTFLKNYKTKIGMVGFKNVIHSFEAVSNVINIDIDYKIIKHESEVQNTLDKLKEEGISIIVGDAITVRLASEKGMQGVLITSGKESIMEAFNNVRRMNDEIQRLRSKSSVYENLLNRLETNIGLLSENGDVLFSNSSFNNYLNIDGKGASLYNYHSYFKTIILEQLENNYIRFQLATNQFGEVFDIYTGRLNNIESKVINYIELKKEIDNEESQLKFIYSHPFIERTPEYIMSGEIYKKAKAIAKRKMDHNHPILLLGEKGTGKRMFVNMIGQEIRLHENHIIEIEINNPSTVSFNKLINVIQKENENSIIHIRGMENTTKSQQKKVFSSIPNIKSALIFSFIGEIVDIKENKWNIDQEFLSYIKDEPIFLEAIRDRGSILEDLINTFILHFNEEFGKQVVGVGSDSMEILLSHPWYGNLIELRTVVRKLVENSESEYINNVSEILTQRNKQDYNGVFLGSYLNLRQSLVDIEKDVIQQVLEEEKMNQSKAAKRLEINRSTLWRKIKRS